MTTRRRTAVAAVALVVVVAVVAGCAVAPERHAEQTPAERVPFDLLDKQAPPLVPTTATGNTEPVTLCFIQGGHVVPTVEQLDAPVDLLDTIKALVSPPRQGQRTAVADVGAVRRVRLIAGIARVDLRGSASLLSGHDQLLEVAQMVCTLTSQPGVGQVSFTLDEAPIDVPQGDGSLSSGPVSRDDYVELLSVPGTAG